MENNVAPVLSGWSSLEALDLSEGQAHSADRATSPMTLCLPKDGAETISGIDLPRPLHVVVPSCARGRRVAGCDLHGRKADLLRRDVLLCDDGATVVVPELALAQVVSGMSMPQVVMLLDQYCGTYRCPRPEAIAAFAKGLPSLHAHYLPAGSDATSCRAATFYGVRPLVSTEGLRRFVGEHRGEWGVNRIARALPHVTDGLRSPAEALFHLQAFGPAEFGGFALPPATADLRIDLNSTARGYVDKPYVVADFAWEDQRVAVEVLGAADHGGEGITETSLREKAYRAIGWKCVTMSYKEIEDSVLFRKSMGDISRALGHRLRTDVKDFEVRRDWLRGEIVLRGDEAAPNIHSYRDLLSASASEDRAKAPTEAPAETPTKASAKAPAATPAKAPAGASRSDGAFSAGKATIADGGGAPGPDDVVPVDIYWVPTRGRWANG